MEGFINYLLSSLRHDGCLCSWAFDENLMHPTNRQYLQSTLKPDGSPVDGVADAAGCKCHAVLLLQVSADLRQR